MPQTSYLFIYFYYGTSSLLDIEKNNLRKIKTLKTLFTIVDTNVIISL